MLRGRAIREGSVGLISIVGITVFILIAVWLRGSPFTQRGYRFFVRFNNISGIKEGGIVRYRGFEIGKVREVKPGINGIDVTIEVESGDLLIPADAAVKTVRTGFIGEANIEIYPSREIDTESISNLPTSPDCNSSLIVCEEDILQGENTPGFDDLVPGFAKLIDLYSDSDLLENLNGAANEVTKLSQEISKITALIQEDFKLFSEAAISLTEAANTTEDQINKLGTEYQETARRINTLISDINTIFSENQEDINRTVENLARTTEELNSLIVNLDGTITEVNASINPEATQRLIANLNTLSENSVELTANLKEISENINQPANLVAIQQTLDSARATFENAQKISADLDDLIGDPQFRENLRKLVNGLSDLVSSNEPLPPGAVLVQGLQTPSELELPIQLEYDELVFVPLDLFSE